MKTVAIIVALVFCPMLTNQTGATITDGNSLLQSIRLVRKLDDRHATEKEAKEAVMALEYLHGYLDASSAWARVDEACPFKFPQPNGITVGQLVEVMDKYLSNHPEQLHESATLLIFLAIKESFPNPVYSHSKSNDF